MNFKSKMLSIIGAGMLALSIVPASAENLGNTTSLPVSVTVAASSTNGGVTWKIEEGTPFTAVTPSLTEATTSTGQLKITVEDTRFNRRGWSLSVSGQDFVGDKGGKIAAASTTIKPGAVAWVAGDKTPLPTASQVILGPTAQTIFAAPVNTGSGRYTATFDGSVSVPANTMADTYKTTITVSMNTAP